MRNFAWFGIVLMYTVCWSQQPEAAGIRSPVQVRDTARDALRSAMTAEPTVREAALKNLVRTAHQDVATEALIALVRLHIPDTETMALDVLPQLSDMNLANVLGAAVRTRDNHFRMVLARRVLQRFATDPPAPRLDNDGAGAAGAAAVMLTDSADAADRVLIGRILRMKPRESGLWLAVAKMGVADQEELWLARSVMQDKQTPGRTRLAVAAALAPADSEAREFVVNTITAFLEKFGPVEADLIIAGAYSQSPHDQARWSELNWNLRYLGTLEFLQTPDAERLTFEYVDSTNQYVRRALGLVAVMRWPERFLKLRSRHLDEWTQLLAALSVFHPDLVPRVHALVGQEKLDKIRQQMIKEGVGLFFSLPGGAGLALL